MDIRTTNVDELNLDQLKKLAAEHEIDGRSKMNKTQLINNLNSAKADIMSDEGIIDADTLKELKRRRPSHNERNDEGSVIREGKNLSGNVPFRKKFYYLDPQFVDLENATDIYKDAVNAAPNQVKLILRYMREFEITSSDEAKQGKVIVDEAKAKSYIQSKIPSANLFAYYRRVLEALGVTEG